MLALIFDTETTGLPKTKTINPELLHDWPYIVQFSYIVFDLSLLKIVHTKDYIVKLPENVSIPSDSTAIHGITNEMCSSKGFNLESIFQEFFYYINDVDIVVGHNVSFDIDMIKIELLRLIYSTKLTNRQLKGFKSDFYCMSNLYDLKKVCCTLQDSIELCNIQAVNKYGRTYTKFPKLSELHETLFNTTPLNLHNSLNDILVTLRCFVKLKYNYDLLDKCESFALATSNIYSST